MTVLPGAFERRFEVTAERAVVASVVLWFKARRFKALHIEPAIERARNTRNAIRHGRRA